MKNLSTLITLIKSIATTCSTRSTATLMISLLTLVSPLQSPSAQPTCGPGKSRLERICGGAPRDVMGCCKIPKQRKRPKRSVAQPARAQAACPEGKVRNEDNLNHCCYPGQYWSRRARRCAGAPECPSSLGLVKVRNTCKCPDGQEINAYTAGHCCSHGQEWVESRGCVGQLMCRRGYVELYGACVKRSHARKERKRLKAEQERRRLERAQREREARERARAEADRARARQAQEQARIKGRGQEVLRVVKSLDTFISYAEVFSSTCQGLKNRASTDKTRALIRAGECMSDNKVNELKAQKRKLERLAVKIKTDQYNVNTIDRDIDREINASKQLTRKIKSSLLSFRRELSSYNQDNTQSLIISVVMLVVSVPVFFGAREIEDKSVGLAVGLPVAIMGFTGFILTIINLASYQSTGDDALESFELQSLGEDRTLIPMAGQRRLSEPAPPTFMVPLFSTTF